MPPSLPFSEGDRVHQDGAEGQVVTVNHDDPDNVIYLVRFDAPLAADVDDRGPFEIRTVWVYVGYLELVQPAVEWAKDHLRFLASQPIEPHTLEEIRRVRALHDKWAGVDREEVSRRARAGQLLDGLNLDGAAVAQLIGEHRAATSTTDRPGRD